MEARIEIEEVDGQFDLVVAVHGVFTGAVKRWRYVTRAEAEKARDLAVTLLAIGPSPVKAN